MGNPTEDIYKSYQPAGKEAGIFPLPEGLRVLEIGIGAGKLLEVLRERGNEVYGVDVSADLVEKAKANGFEQVHLVDVSTSPLPFDEDAFDVVFCYEVLEHLTNPHRMFCEIRRVLKPGHLLYFSVPAQEIDMGYGPCRHAFVYPGLLEKANLERFLMQMYFRIEEVVEPQPHDHLLGHNYRLSNQKRPGAPDIVEVVIQDRNVQDLYGHVLTPAQLEAEVAREVEGYLNMLRTFCAGQNWSGVSTVLRLLVQEYPGHFPMYPRIAGMLFDAGKDDLARGFLAFVHGKDGVPAAIQDEVAAMLAAHPPE